MLKKPLAEVSRAPCLGSILSFLLFISASFFLLSCTPSILTIHREAVTHRSAASYYVGSPDYYSVGCYPKGERMRIYWALPFSGCGEPLPAEMVITLRFGNLEQQENRVAITKPRGHTVYELLNEEYFLKKGIETYKIELFYGNRKIASQTHLLWTEWIEVGAY